LQVFEDGDEATLGALETVKEAGEFAERGIGTREGFMDGDSVAGLAGESARALGREARGVRGHGAFKEPLLAAGVALVTPDDLDELAVDFDFLSALGLVVASEPVDELVVIGAVLSGEDGGSACVEPVFVRVGRRAKGSFERFGAAEFSVFPGGGCAFVEDFHVFFLV
jgi:hypothetical protein